MSVRMTLLAVCLVYLVIVVVIGAVAYRRTGSGTEEYFLGGRSARTLVLFMALLGTNVTPFVIMGIPGLSYHHGVGVFGLNAAIVALGVPWTIYAIGYPAWKAARRVGAITPAELSRSHAALTRGYPRSFETAEQIARAVAQLFLHGLPDDFFDRFVSDVTNVTADDAGAVARRYLPLGDMQVVIVGDRERVGGPLAELGVGPVEEFPPDGEPAAQAR